MFLKDAKSIDEDDIDDTYCVFVVVPKDSHLCTCADLDDIKDEDVAFCG